MAQECESHCDHDVCTPSSSIITKDPNMRSCRCDRHCSFFQDCCEGAELTTMGCVDPAAGAHFNVERSLWSCHSLYALGTVDLTRFSPMQVGVYVVSMCPPTWFTLSQKRGLSMAEFGLVANLCSAVNSSLPLASDAFSGRVYKNEYCALCHEVSQMSLWPQTVFCSSVVLDTIREESQLPLAVVREWCDPCVYNTPPTLYMDQTRDVPELPRSCTPALSSCPEFSEAARGMGSDLSAHDYEQIVDNCTEQTKYVKAFSDLYAGDVVYKNPHCVTCNAFTLVYQCFSFDLFRFPFCKSQPNSKWNGSEVEVVLDVAVQTVQVLSDGDTVYRDVPLDFVCPFGRVFSFISFECRDVSCSQFDLPTSNFTCTVTGLSTDSGGSGANQTTECSEELVLDHPFLFLSLDRTKTTYYYLPLRSIVTVSHINTFGYQVVCLDSAVPTKLAFLQALNVLTFVVTIPSILVLCFVSFAYVVPSYIRSVFGMVVANFAVASLLADLVILLSYSGVILTWSENLCFASGILDHYLALAQFSWLLVLTLDVGIRYYRRAKSVHPSFSLRALSIYYCTGWFLPLLVTSFEVAFTHAFGTSGRGDMASCFQFSSFYIGFFFYLFPCFAVIVSCLVALPVLLRLIIMTGFELASKDKTRFVVLFFLLLIMSTDFLLRAAALYVPSSFADAIVGFFRLIVIALRSAYLAAVLLFNKKVPNAVRGLFVSSKSKVKSATAEEVELAKYQRDVSKMSHNREAVMNLELSRLADQLANPSLCMYKE